MQAWNSRSRSRLPYRGGVRPNSIPLTQSVGWGLLLLLVALAPMTAAQMDASPEPGLDLEEIRALRAQAEGDATLEGELRDGILTLLDDAMAAMKAAAQDRARVDEFERELAGVDRKVEKLREALARLEKAAAPPLPDGAGVEQAETRLARERARLGAYRNALVNAERLSKERADSRNSISRQLGELDQQIELLDEELRGTIEQDVHLDLKEAARIGLLARKQAAVAKAERSRVELALLDARGALIPLQIDQAQRRVDRSERLVSQLEYAALELRRRDALESLRRIREQAREVAALSPVLEEVANETELFAETLWGEEGVVAKSEATAKALLDTRRQLSELKRIIEVMRRKFAVFGYRGSIARWWPQIPEGFPGVGAVASSVRALEARVPEVEFQLIRFEEQRRGVLEFREQVLRELRAESPTGVAPETERAVNELLVARRELLDELTQRYGRYSDQLVERETVSRFFLSEIERVTAFLYEQLLWVRSVPRPIIPRPSDIGGGLAWLFSPHNWATAARATMASLTESWAKGLAGLGVLVLLLATRRPTKRRMAQLAERAAQVATDRYLTTAEALAHTLLLAAPLPLALLLLREALLRPEASPFVFSAYRALYYTALIAALLMVTRQLVAPNGLADAHFGWPRRITRRLHRGLALSLIGFLVPIHIALHLAMAGVRLTSPEELQRYHNALGRVAFVAALVWLGSLLLNLFRPRRPPDAEAEGGHLYVYVYPVVVVATFVPAVLAALGYYVSGILLAYQMLRTLWLVLAVMVLAGLLFRWRTVSHGGIAPGALDADRSASPVSLSAAEVQVRRLFRFAVTLVAAIGLYVIWSGALPALQILKRVQVWPRVAVLEASAPRIPALSAMPGGTVEAPASEGQAETESGRAASSAPIPSSIVSPGAPAVAQESEPLTLWKILQSILAGLVSIVLVKNLPGLLELGLQRRTRMDSGARIAFGTLVRYAVMILGVTISFGLLGISWSKVQWLVAALTFGLGFGLQEIVANFVSGLILLAERPVRVGDAVSIGNLQGLVSRIQIRATTITLWDRSEMIVPNKEFITSKLVNWTLSDSKRRIDIPLRVAYGADLDQVKAILLEVARAHPAVLAEPEPQALLLAFGDDAVKFELRMFVEFGQGLQTRDEVHMAIERAFRESGIDFALPQLNLQIPRRGQPPGSSSRSPTDSVG